jgi:hypothetical protein
MAAAFRPRIPLSVYAARVILWYRGTMPAGNGRRPAARLVTPAWHRGRPSSPWFPRAGGAPCGGGRGHVLHTDGALPRLPGRPLAVRRHGRDPARHLLRPPDRPDSRPAPAAAARWTAASRDATPACRRSTRPRRTGTDMNRNRPADAADRGNQLSPCNEPRIEYPDNSSIQPGRAT